MVVVVAAAVRVVVVVVVGVAVVVVVVVAVVDDDAVPVRDVECCLLLADDRWLRLSRPAAGVDMQGSIPVTICHAIEKRVV